VPSILGVAGARACSTETVVPFFGGDNSHSVRRTFRFPEARRATARGVPGARPRLFFSTAPCDRNPRQGDPSPRSRHTDGRGGTQGVARRSSNAHDPGADEPFAGTSHGSARNARDHRRPCTPNRLSRASRAPCS